MATRNTDEPLARVMPGHCLESLVLQAIRTSHDVISFSTLWRPYEGQESVPRSVATKPQAEQFARLAASAKMRHRWLIQEPQPISSQATLVRGRPRTVVGEK